MPPVLSQLRRDHLHIARLLDFLDVELDKAGGPEPLDLELMQEVMHYMTQYPDMYHHPREDLVFERLRAHPGVDDADVDSVLAEHADLSAAGLRFLEAIEALDHDAIWRVDEFVAMARRYTALQRRHLEREERTLFGLAERLLTTDDWRQIDAALLRAPDPLFGPQVRAEYHRIAAALS